VRRRCQKAAVQSSGGYFYKERYDALIQLSMIGDKCASDNIKSSGGEIFSGKLTRPLA
jgi:hypothetical protein